MPIRFRKNVPTAWLRLTIREGRNRQVRRMTAAVGHPTLRLVRVAIGPISLGDLAPGQWRELRPTPVNAAALKRHQGNTRTSRRRNKPSTLGRAVAHVSVPDRVRTADRWSSTFILPGRMGRPESREIASISTEESEDGQSGSSRQEAHARGVPPMPEIDEHPYLEYIDGRIEAKMSPQGKTRPARRPSSARSSRRLRRASRTGRGFPRNCAARSPAGRSSPTSSSCSMSISRPTRG